MTTPTAEPVDLDELEYQARVCHRAELPKWLNEEKLRALITELRYHRANAAEAEARGARKALSEIAEAADRFRQSPLWLSPFACAFVEVRNKYAQKGDGNGA